MFIRRRGYFGRSVVRPAPPALACLRPSGRASLERSPRRKISLRFPLHFPALGIFFHLLAFRCQLDGLELCISSQIFFAVFVYSFLSRTNFRVVFHLRGNV